MKKIKWITIVVFVILGISLTSMVLLNKTEKENIKAENQLSQISEDVEVVDWCAEHSVPESVCTQCNPTLINQFKESGDWCGGHDIPESHCRLCNPEIEFPQEKIIAQKTTKLDWCAEHSIPESVCTQCNPALIDQFKESGDWCGGHDIPESHCRLCNPEIKFPQEELIIANSLESAQKEIEVSLFFRTNTDVCATNDALIQFASSKTADRAGITVRHTISAPQETELEAPAEIVFNENNTTVISSSLKVLVSQWLIDPGDVVVNDEPIAILQSSEMAELQARLMMASAELTLQNKELEREKALVSKNLVTRSDYERRIALNSRAQAEYISVRGLLLSSGINDKDIEKLLEKNTVTNEFILRAPSTGVIAKRIAQIGELLDDGQALALITDPSSLWIEAQLSENQMKSVSVGMEISYTSDNIGLNQVSGIINWVAPYLDQHTRTGTVRAHVSNQSHNLRVGEFGQATISNSSKSQVILIPKDAVQWEGCCNVVFVKESLSRFRPRKVKLIDGPGSYYQVTEGLLEGEEIVVDGSFLLKTELKKTSIGAGCCDVGPVG